LALDSEKLFRMRRHLERVRTSCAAFDTARWVRNLEAGLSEVWLRKEAGLEADHVVVSDNKEVYDTSDMEIFTS